VLDLTIDDGLRLPAASVRRLRVEVARMVRAAARHEGRDDLEVALRLCDDAAIHALNRDYRKKNKPTDVLAFAMREGDAGAAGSEVLGDIVISVETARRQARKGLYAEHLFLASHGLCHLLGYDHPDDAAEAAMNARMAALRTEASRRGTVRAA
jgi:probable rRNA maturation factor